MLHVQLQQRTRFNAAYGSNLHARVLPGNLNAFYGLRSHRRGQVGAWATTDQQAPAAQQEPLLIGMPSSSLDYKTQDPELHSASAKKQFNWYKAWYPLAVIEDLDPQLPSHAKVLGLDLAIWFDRHESKWRAFQDRCPHRLAPLSEGHIDAAGHLYCNYHGWQFDGAGACKGVPQLPQGQSINPKKSCAVSYPTCQREGLLWVWPDASPSAYVESAAPEAWPGLAPELEAYGDKAFTSKHKWYFRDLPASYLAVKENAYNDCSHDTVLHHGVTPASSRTNATPLDMKLVQMTRTGYTIMEASGRFQDVASFPCGARRDFNAGKSAGVAYVVPTDIGATRQFHTFLQTPTDKQQGSQQNQQPAGPGAISSGGKDKASATATSSSTASNAASSSSSSKDTLSSVAKPKPSPAVPKPGLVQAVQLFWMRVQPTWAAHMFSHLLVDADLAMQSRIDINRSVSDHVYMPAAADAGPTAFLRWLKEYGGGGPPVATLRQPFMGQRHTVPSTRQQLLDRFHTHTAQCKACRTAYNNFTVGRQAAALLGLLAGGAAAASAALLLAVGLPADAAAAGRVVSTTVWLGLIGVLCGVAWGALGQILQRFVFVNYDKHHPSKM